MSTNRSYGAGNRQVLDDELDRHVEEIAIQGYSVIPNQLGAEDCRTAAERLDAVYERQEQETGRDTLQAIQELNLARCPLAYDDWFIKTATLETILTLVRRIIGDYYFLHLQNGIINRPNEEHHQTAWHRDLPYQDFVISKPLALGALVCVNEFNRETGGTWVLPHSHKRDTMPSPEYITAHEQCAEAPAGSVILFDAMLYHRAGYNSSQIVRRGINHVYAAGILRQQVDIPNMLGGKFSEDPFLSMLLGYDAATPPSVKEWREKRLTKMQNR